jgi:pectinesterase
MIVVAKDGSGDFSSLQAAIDAAEPLETIHVRAGTYDEKVVIHRDGLRIIGEDRENTVLCFDDYAKKHLPDGSEMGTFLTWTLLVAGKDVRIENMTIRNGAGEGRAVGQAVAAYLAGDRSVMTGCRLMGHQDTLFCGPTMKKVADHAMPRIVPEGVLSVADVNETFARHYFEDCFIEGNVDYIFGPDRCWFERCELHAVGEEPVRIGWYTAANTPKGQEYGMVFRYCHLTGDCPDGTMYLGRPWREFARTLFLFCEMDACVNPLGFADWENPFRPVTERCGEYGTTGSRADLSTRHPGAKRWTSIQAEAVTLVNVLGGNDGWEPARQD